MNNEGHDPLAVANFFIKKSGSGGVFLMKLIKLCYIAHGFTLAIEGNILVNEYAEAWRYGPVFPSIFHYFKTTRPITKPAVYYNIDNDTLEEITSDFSSKEKQIMNITFKKYNQYSGDELSGLTHIKPGPWAGRLERRRTYKRVLNKKR